jgi:transposase
MSRFQLLPDAQWELIADLLPRRTGRQGRPFADARPMVEGIIYRYRCGIAWRDLPKVFGPWQTVWTWHRRMAGDGTWDHVLSLLHAQAEREGLIDWRVSVDSTIARAHQHATNTRRDTGGWIELHEFGRAGTTRIRPSRLTMPSDAPAAGSRRRFTSWWTEPGCRW